MGKYSKTETQRRTVDGAYNKICGICSRRWLEPPEVVPISMLNVDIEIKRCGKHVDTLLFRRINMKGDLN